MSIGLWRQPDDDPGAAPIHLARMDAHRDRIRAVAFSADGRLLATGGDDDTMRLWDVRHPDLPEPAGALTRVGHRVTSLAFSPRNDPLAVGSSDGRMRVYRLTI